MLFPLPVAEFICVNYRGSWCKYRPVTLAFKHKTH